MKNRWIWLLILLIGFGLMLTVAFLVRLPIPPYLDFQALYHADLGLRRGIRLYDFAGQVRMIADLAGVSTQQVVLRPFAYPPWYALSTLYLAWLPIDVAARLWFELNIVMLLSASWLLTEGWGVKRRAAASILSILFVPVLGVLFVGQFVFPVLLGAALFGYALHRERSMLAVLGAVLVTFKPHIGWFILPAGLLQLALRRDSFGRRTLWLMLAAASGLAALGFLADPAWPVTYLQALSGFGSSSGISACDLCFSLPLLLLRWVTGGPALAQSVAIGLALLAGLLLWIARRRSFLWKEPGSWIAAAVLVTLLVDPYLHNYDFSILLVPLLYLAVRVKERFEWSLLGAAYLLPWLGLALWGREGNAVLLISTLLTAVLLYRRTGHIDVSATVA